MFVSGSFITGEVAFNQALSQYFTSLLEKTGKYIISYFTLTFGFWGSVKTHCVQ